MTSTRATNIGLGFGAIEHWHDGIGEFTQQLVQGIASRADALQRERGWHFQLHLPKRWHGRFGNHVGYIDIQPWHRHWHRGAMPFDLWHGLHGSSRVLPPTRAERLVETLHDLRFIHDAPNDRVRQRRLARARARLARADAVVAISQYSAGDIVRTLHGKHAESTRTVVIHNGVADMTRSPRDAVLAVRDHPLVQRTGYFLHLSRMSANKNVDAILDLAAHWSDHAFVLAGPSHADTLAVRALAHGRGLANVLVCLDVSDAQKAWLYEACKAFIFPSRFEGFGLPPAEAMFFGKPVCLSRMTSLPEVGGDVATYFDDDTPAAMRRIVEHACRTANPTALRAQALQFTWDKAINSYLSLYADTLARGSR